MYPSILEAWGFSSRGYTTSLLQSAAKLLKSRYFSVSSKARAANPYLSRIFCSGQGLYSFLRETHLMCLGSRGGVAGTDPLMQRFPDLFQGSREQPRCEITTSEKRKRIARFGFTSEASSFVHGRMQRERKQDLGAGNLVHEMRVH